jgi:ribulose-phosphate 3-epimerase
MVEAGASNVTFHVESPEVESDPIGAAKEIRKLGCHVGVTLKPGTSIKRVLTVLEHVDLVLVMSVEPGFGGQSFMRDQLDKVRVLHPLMKPHQRIEIDGGIDAGTIGEAYAAGVDWFVAGSSIFGAADRVRAMTDLRQGIAAVEAHRPARGV